MTAPIALQFYSVRDELAKDYEGVVKRIADMGFVGIEYWGAPGKSPEQAYQLFNGLGLKIPSAHMPMPLGDKKNEVLETMDAIGAYHLVSPWTDPQNYATEASIQAMAELFNQANEVAVENGLKFSIHNHDFEMAKVAGRPAYRHLMDTLDPEVLFQVDTYWAKVAGLDPAAVVAGLGERAPLLHIKDGPAVNREDHMTALGEGVMDIPAIVKAGGSHTEWLIVELDRCATDMLEAVAKSYTYLTSQGLAQGRI